jgi:hypothetical protein
MRFWANVNKDGPNGCWEWTGIKHQNGYGKFFIKTKYILAHRHSYSEANGPIPEGMFLDHICRNIQCVNPEHLRPCSHSQNMWNTLKSPSNTSGFKGVTRHKSGRWQAQIRANGQQTYLGLFDLAIDAHAAYSAAATKLHGEFANPDTERQEKTA